MSYFSILRRSPCPRGNFSGNQCVKMYPTSTRRSDQNTNFALLKPPSHSLEPPYLKKKKKRVKGNSRFAQKGRFRNSLINVLHILLHVLVHNFKSIAGTYVYTACGWTRAAYNARELSRCLLPTRSSWREKKKIREMIKGGPQPRGIFLARGRSRLIPGTDRKPTSLSPLCLRPWRNAVMRRRPSLLHARAAGPLARTSSCRLACFIVSLIIAWQDTQTPPIRTSSPLYRSLEFPGWLATPRGWLSVVLR